MPSSKASTVRLQGMRSDKGGALVIAGRDPLNAAAGLARACAIPAVWGVSDIMHSVVDGQGAQVDGDLGELTVNSEQ